MNTSTTTPTEQHPATASLPVVTLEDHLAALYPAGTPGDLLAYVTKPCRRRFGVPTNLDAFVRKIMQLDGQGLDVYLTVNTLDGAAVRKRNSKARGNEEEVKAVVALVADVDAAGKDGHNYPPQARILQALADMPLPASIVIVSGKPDAGLHPYWLLREPFIIHGNEDRDRIKTISTRWQRLLKAKLAPYDLDSTFDLVRVLRPIGTTNHKYGTTVKALIFDPQRRYRLEDFDQHLPPPPAPPPVTYRPFDANPNSIISRARAYVGKIPGAVSGQNGHDATFHVACVLVCGFGLSVDDAFPILAEWNQTCQPPWSEEELRHKLDGAQRQDGERGYLLRDPPPENHRHNGKSCSTREHRAENFPLTDTGLAERFALQHGDDIRFCFAWGKWLVWDNTRWKIDDGGMVEQLGKRTVRSIFREAADEPDDARRKALASFAKSSESATKRSAMLTLARSEPPIPITPEVLDKNAWILNCPNGKLDLQTGQLHEHRREDYVTKLCPVEYRPDALCPIWLATLDKCFDRTYDLIDFVQRFAGYCLTGDVSEQILTIWHGIGANGKSTILNALMEMLGLDYSMKATADLLLMKRDSAHPTALTDLHGKRLVACIETDEGRKLAEALVKELTGGDPIRARRMREDFWQFNPTHKVVLACNHRPTVGGTDHAIWRRLKLVPFNVVIPPAERDKQLPAKLREELTGILAWAVRGCLDWQKIGLGEPKAIIDATADYQIAEDVLMNFLAECCIIAPDAKVKAADLVDAYKEYSGDKDMTTRKLTVMVTEKGIERQKSNGLWYRGVGLLNSGTTERQNDFTL
jgi:putative DNA primase/helicase